MAVALLVLLLTPHDATATEDQTAPVAPPETATTAETAESEAHRTAPAPTPRTAAPPQAAPATTETAQPQATQATPAPQPAIRIGASSGQPLPRFVSIKSSEANARRGPSLTHRVDWVFRHPGMPIIVTAEYGHWRRVMDRDGLGGWVHYALLSSTRTVIVDVDMADLRRRPDRAAPVIARLERGAIARLSNCADDWCELRAGRYKGWTEAAALWGTTMRSPGDNSATNGDARSAAVAQAAIATD